MEEKSFPVDCYLGEIYPETFIAPDVTLNGFMLVVCLFGWSKTNSKLLVAIYTFRMKFWAELRPPSFVCGPVLLIQLSSALTTCLKRETTVQQLLSLQQLQLMYSTMYFQHSFKIKFAGTEFINCISLWLRVFI